MQIIDLSSSPNPCCKHENLVKENKTLKDQLAKGQATVKRKNKRRNKKRKKSKSLPLVSSRDSTIVKVITLSGRIILPTFFANLLMVMFMLSTLAHLTLMIIIGTFGYLRPL